MSAQFRLWEVCPDDTYVANPNRGFSAHSRGNTVDVTLVGSLGNELEMPTGFDDFSGKADRDYSDVEEVPTEHALLLQNTMEKYGFEGYFGEWWHFQDEISYPVEDVFEPVTAERYYAQCNEFISLRTHPDTAAEVIITMNLPFWRSAEPLRWRNMPEPGATSTGTSSSRWRLADHISSFPCHWAGEF